MQFAVCVWLHPTADASASPIPAVCVSGIHCVTAVAVCVCANGCVCFVQMAVLWGQSLCSGKFWNVATHCGDNLEFTGFGIGVWLFLKLLKKALFLHQFQVVSLSWAYCTKCWLMDQTYSKLFHIFCFINLSLLLRSVCVSPLCPWGHCASEHLGAESQPLGRMAKAFSGIAVFPCIGSRGRWKGILWPALESFAQ